MLTDEHWSIVEPLLKGRKTEKGRTGDDNRVTLEGILFALRTKLPWRDLLA